MNMSPTNNWTEWRARLADVDLPALIVDLDALRTNMSALISEIQSDSIALRIMANEIPCPTLLRQILLDGAPRVHGLACQTSDEASLLAAVGFTDIFVLDPVAHASEAQSLALIAQKGCHILSLVDHPSHLMYLSTAAVEYGVTLHVCIDVDIQQKPGAKTDQTVATSAIRDSEQARNLAEQVRQSPGLQLKGIRTITSSERELKARTLLGFGNKRARNKQLDRRLAVIQTLRNEEYDIELVNGGDSRNLRVQSTDPALTELMLGSECLGGTQADADPSSELVPAVLLALPISRRLDATHSACSASHCEPNDISVYTPLGLRIVNEASRDTRQLIIEATDLAPDVEIGDPIILQPTKPGQLLACLEQIQLFSSDQGLTSAPTIRAL